MCIMECPGVMGWDEGRVGSPDGDGGRVQDGFHRQGELKEHN